MSVKFPLKLAVAAIVLTAPIAACTADAARPQRVASASRNGDQCFTARDVRGFSAQNNDTVVMRIGVDRYFRLSGLGGCNDVDWATGIGIQSRGAGFICSGGDADLIVPSSTLGTQRCPVLHIERLTSAEVALLPKGKKP